MPWAKLGMSPIAWWNDDLPELSDDVTLDECLRQSRAAGFTGMELGRRFPRTPGEMLPILKAADTTLCGGWFSGTLAGEGLDANKARIAPMIELFRAVDAPCIVYGEVARSIQGRRDVPLARKPVLTGDEMRAYGAKVTTLFEWCEDAGMPLVYHHHMGAVVQFEHELDAFMAATGEAVRLCFDTGHMHMAGGENLAAIDRHHRRIGHVHTKDVRQSVLDGLDFARDSFLDAIVKGVFTVPGDGDIRFGPIVGRLGALAHNGWFVVEAEQDPKQAPPFEMALKGHAELMRLMEAAGYDVVT